MVVSGGQLLGVTQGQQMIVQHINTNKATIATINGQQVLIRPNAGNLIMSILTKMYLNNIFELLGNSTNILSSGSQTIKLVRPQQSVHKVTPSVPPLTPRLTQPINSINQLNQVKVIVFILLFSIIILNDQLL